MTDFTLTNALTTIRRPSLRHLRLPKFAIGLAVTALSGAVMRAFEMAFVAPYSAMRGELPMAPDADLEGRDPNW